MSDENIETVPEGQENENAPSENPQLTNKEAKSKLRDKYNKEIDKLHRTFRKETYPNYKDPEEVDSQIIDLSQLQDPPDDFKILNLDARHPEMADGFALVLHHFWNINPQIFPRNAKDRIKIFRKLAYNQDEQYRPRDLRDLSDLSRDAGPRLLKPEVLHRLGKLPVSRHYPEFTEGTDWEEHRTRPLYLPQNQTSAETDGDGSDGHGALALEETPPNLDLIRECLERLLIQLRYRQLVLVGSNRGEELLHALIDTSESYRRKRLPLHKVPLTLDNNHNVEKAFGGFTQPEYPSRERGPTGNEFEPASNSRFDCIMMAGKFLDAGITKVDVENLHSHGGQETNAHRNFLNMVQADWKQGDSVGSAEARQYFHRLFNNLQASDFRDLMYKSTLLRPQFNHTISRTFLCDNDHEITTPLDTVTSSLLCFDGPYISDGSTGVTMQEVLQSLFPQEESPEVYGDETPCTDNVCEGNPKRTIIRRSMPLRLAVSFSSQVSPSDHTSNNIRLKFYNDAKGGLEDIAVYRWIGGVYADTKNEVSMTHYRIYWTDSLRGGKPSETISIYDPLQADGKVIEGVFPASQNEPVPAAWWEGKFKPVLFYERVFNPDTLDITLAAAILGDMKHASDNSQYILQVHNPQWKISLPSGDQPGNHDGSHSPRPRPPPTSGNPSRSSDSQKITGYAGAVFDTELNGQDYGDVHMQDDIVHKETSRPHNNLSQNTGKTAAAGARYSSYQNRRSMPASDNDGMFRVFNSDMSQVAPDLPRDLLIKHYMPPSATNTSASNFAQRYPRPHTRFIPLQPSNVQNSTFPAQNLQINSPFEPVASGTADLSFAQSVDPLNQTGASHKNNGFPSPAPNFNEFLRATPLMSNLNLPLSGRLAGCEGQIPIADSPYPLFDLFGEVIEQTTQQAQGDFQGTLPSYPGGDSSGGDLQHHAHLAE